MIDYVFLAFCLHTKMRLFGLSFVLFVSKLSADKGFVFDLVMNTETDIKNSKLLVNRFCNFLCFQINIYLVGALFFLLRYRRVKACNYSKMSFFFAARYCQNNFFNFVQMHLLLLALCLSYLKWPNKIYLLEDLRFELRFRIGWNGGRR